MHNRPTLKTRSVDEDDRGRRVPPTGPPPAKKGKKWLVSTQNFGSTSPARGGSQNLQKNMTRRPTTTYIPNMARRPTTTYIPNMDTKANNHIYTKRRNLWRCLGFRQPTSQLARNFLNFLPGPSHVITRHIDKFRDFRTSFGFYII